MGENEERFALKAEILCESLVRKYENFDFVCNKIWGGP